MMMRRETGSFTANPSTSILIFVPNRGCKSVPCAYTQDKQLQTACIIYIYIYIYIYMEREREDIGVGVGRQRLKA